MRRQLSPDEEDAVLCLLAVRSRTNKQTKDSDAMEGSDDDSSCCSSTARKTTISSEDDVPIILPPPQSNVGVLSTEDLSSVMLLPNITKKATTKKQMICECGALILVRTQWKHKQSKKHIQFMLRKLAFQREQFVAVSNNPFSQENQQPQRCDDETSKTPQEQPSSHHINKKNKSSELQMDRSFDNAGFLVTNSTMYGTECQRPQILFLAPMHDPSTNNQQMGAPLNQPTAPIFANPCHSPRQGQSQIMAQMQAAQPRVFYFAHHPQQQWQQAMMAPFGLPKYSLF